MLATLLAWANTFDEGRRAALGASAAFFVLTALILAQKRRLRGVSAIHLLVATALAASTTRSASTLLAYAMLASLSVFVHTYAAYDVFDDGVRRTSPSSDMSAVAEMVQLPSRRVAIAWLFACVALPCATWVVLLVFVVPRSFVDS